MNAPATAAAIARPDDYQEEARALVEWLFTQAAFYRKHAPACAGDIQKFEDAAALIDTFRAGLVLVPPHPAMQAELIRWTRMADELPPDDGSMVLLWAEGDEMPWYGYREGSELRSAEGQPYARDTVTHWAEHLTGPAPAQTVEARHEEPQP